MSGNGHDNRMWKLLVALLLAAVAVQIYYIKTINHKLDRLEAQAPAEAEQVLAPPVQALPPPAQALAQLAPIQPMAPPAVRAPRRPLANRMPLNMPPDPFDHMEAMSKMFDEFFDNASMPLSSMEAMSFGSAPRVNVKGDSYVVTMDVPGLDKSTLNVQARGDMLSISGTKSSSRQSQGFQSSESQSFERSFNLPGPVDAGKLKVDYDNKTLKITCPTA